MYCKPSENESVLRQILLKKIAARNVFKHRQLTAAELGDSILEQINKLLQASTKIFTNSIPGGMGYSGCFLFDMVNYNSVTSGARISIMTGYAFTEKFIAGNLYLTSYDDAVHYLMLMIRACPSVEVNTVMQKYKLIYPTTNHILTYFTDGLRYYTKVAPIINDLRSVIDTLSPEEKAYVYYGGCLKNFAELNTDLLRQYIKDFHEPNVSLDFDEDPLESIGKIPTMIKTTAMAMNFDVIDRVSDFKKVSSRNPGGLRHLYGICRNMTYKIREWEDLWGTFFKIDVKSPKTMYHPNMIRRCVRMSDTDSIVFSTSKIVKWFAPGEHMTRNTKMADTFTVFLLTQTLRHLFLNLSTNFGMEGNDRRRIDMKNEYSFPVFINSSQGKHYLAGIQSQEGRIYSELRMDIKGVNYRGSDLPQITQDVSQDYLADIIKKLTVTPTISMADILDPVVNYEQTILKSLMNGEKHYLNLMNIKPKEEYKSDAESNNYFYYRFWDYVFAPKYGAFDLPNKVLEIPLIRNDVLRSPEWLEKLRQFDKATHARMLEFITTTVRMLDGRTEKAEKYKSIGRVIIPQSLPVIPEIFREIMDMRVIIFKNCRPFYLAMQSIGLGINDTSYHYIASDFYQTPQKIEVPHY